MTAMYVPMLVGVVVLGIVTVAAPTAHARPKLLDAEPGCERWLGSSSGNDPSVRLHLRLCPDGDEVRGEVQWSSLRSGWSLRAVRGRWDGEELVLRDERLLEDRPSPGWRFCTVDLWELTRAGDRLTGEYTSRGCDDRADVQLERMVDQDRDRPHRDRPNAAPLDESAGLPDGPPGRTPSPGHSPPRGPPTSEPSPPEPTAPPSRETGGCGACWAPGGFRSSTASWITALLLFAIVLGTRRRSLLP